MELLKVTVEENFFFFYKNHTTMIQWSVEGISLMNTSCIHHLANRLSTTIHLLTLCRILDEKGFDHTNSRRDFYAVQ